MPDYWDIAVLVVVVVLVGIGRLRRGRLEPSLTAEGKKELKRADLVFGRGWQREQFFWLVGLSIFAGIFVDLWFLGLLIFAIGLQVIMERHYAKKLKEQSGQSDIRSPQ